MRELSPEQAAFFCSRASDLEEDDGWQKVRKLTSRKNLAVCLFTEWLNHRERHKSRLLFMHLESAMYLLALSPLPRYQVSGLMSRPMFHYRREGLFVKSKDSWLLFALKYLAARAFARRTGFERIFVMDPWAQKYAASRWHTKRFQLVPDPYGPEPGDPRPIASSEPMAERPLTLLIAGALAPRKGIHSTVDALSRAAESTRRGVRVRLVGEPEPGQADYVSQNIRRLKDLGVEVVADLRFVDDDELDMCIAEAHIVLTPYINPRTSSGILYRAAHFGTPIISNDRGLLGRLVSMHKLGKAIDTTDPDVYARCLEEVVTTGLVMGFEPESARRLADGSSPPVFAAAFLAERV
jgi:glycosyltransferase involved in cell wall biosynthesis